MAVSLRVVGASKVAQVFAQLPDKMTAGVKIYGPAAQYGLVWEWGSVRITKPGPKTTWGVNPDGKTVILTITAPQGWIRVNKQQYLDILRDEWRKLHFTTIDPKYWKRHLEDMLWKAAVRCSRVMEATAPYDTGDLRSTITAVNEPDPSLDGTYNKYGPTWLALENWLKG